MSDIAQYEHSKSQLVRKLYKPVIDAIGEIERRQVLVTNSTIGKVLALNYAQTNDAISLLVQSGVLFSYGTCQNRVGTAVGKYSLSESSEHRPSSEYVGEMSLPVDIKAIRKAHRDQLKALCYNYVLEVTKRIQPATKDDVAQRTGLTDLCVGAHLREAYKQGALFRVKKGKPRDTGYAYIYSSVTADLAPFDRNRKYKSFNRPENIHTQFAAMALR